MDIWEVVPALAVFCVGVFLYVRLCLRFPPAIILSGVAYSMITKSASVAYIETVEVYLIEVGMISSPIGATIRLILYNLIVFGIALAVVVGVLRVARSDIAARMSQFGTEEYDQQLRLTLKLSAALLGLQIVNALLSPPYALPGSNVDRQQFWANIRFPFVADLIGNVVFFIPAVAGVALAYGKVTKNRYFSRFSGYMMLAYGLLFLLTGARFNGPLTALLVWLSTYWIMLWASGVKVYVKRIGLLLALAVGVFLTFGYLEVADRGISKMTGSAWNGLVYRAFALQGNVSYAGDALTNVGERRAPALLLADMAYIENTYMPPGLATSYIYKGVNLAGSLPGSSMLVYGYWLGLVPMAVFAVLFGFVSGVFIYLILSGRFILILPAAYLYLWASNAEARGSFAPFLDHKFLIFAGVILVALLIPSPVARQPQTANPSKREMTSRLRSR